jgi:phospholipid-translocating ATPase
VAEKSSLEVGNTLFVQVELEVLHVLPFDSVRKRMSVLVRDPASGERKLFCKGADSNMLPRLARPQTQVSPSSLCLVRENDGEHRDGASSWAATCCRVSRVLKLRSVRRRLCV